MKRFSVKLIDEVWLVSVDWVDELPAGVTVTEGAVTIGIHPDSIVTDAGKDSLLGSVDHTDTKIAAMVKAGGVAPCRYVLSFAASFSDGQKDIEQVELPVLALQP